MSEPTNSISSNFNSGASYLISEENYDWWILNNGGKGPGMALIGRPDGQFVAPSNEMDEVLLKANGNPNLPDIQGKGNQYSLHQAMLIDETGRLQEMVEEYVAEEDVYNRKKMLPDLIYAWTGVLDEDKFGRGQYLSDARKLEALEVIIGRDFTSAYGANPAEGAQVKNTMQCNISN